MRKLRTECGLKLQFISLKNQFISIWGHAQDEYSFGTINRSWVIRDIIKFWQGQGSETSDKG